MVSIENSLETQTFCVLFLILNHLVQEMLNWSLVFIKPANTIRINKEGKGTFINNLVLKDNSLLQALLLGTIFYCLNRLFLLLLMPAQKYLILCQYLIYHREIYLEVLFKANND